MASIPSSVGVQASTNSWMTAVGNLKLPTRQDAINWVPEAWRSIKVETLVHSLLVCGLSNALDGSQDNLVSSDVPAVNTDEIKPAEEEDIEIDCNADVLDPFSEDKEDDS